MSLILCIDTSLELASVTLVEDGNIIAVKTNATQFDHASWIHKAIALLFTHTGKSLQQLDAVAVTSGPGSYTGLRVGLATAKGLCYAMQLPLITETTLKLIASRALIESGDKKYTLPVLVAPMIDARRMEVFTCLYNENLHLLVPPAAMILESGSFQQHLEDNLVLFAGNGVSKFKELSSHPHALYYLGVHKPEDLAFSATNKFEDRHFSELAYTEPDYFKNVYTGK